MTEYCAELRAPNGERSHYSVTARNKNEAREKVRLLYRRDTPSPRYGFYGFSQMRLTWIEEQ